MLFGQQGEAPGQADHGADDGHGQQNGGRAFIEGVVGFRHGAGLRIRGIRTNLVDEAATVATQQVMRPMPKHHMSGHKAVGMGNTRHKGQAADNGDNARRIAEHGQSRSVAGTVGVGELTNDGGGSAEQGDADGRQKGDDMTGHHIVGRGAPVPDVKPVGQADGAHHQGNGPEQKAHFFIHGKVLCVGDMRRPCGRRFGPA